MALQDYYNTGDDSNIPCYDDAYYGQTFIANSNYDIKEVKVKIWKKNSPGNVIVSIRATDVIDGKPTGGDLVSVTVASSTITHTSSPGDWYTFTFVTPYSLTADIKYAIIVRTVSGNSTNYIAWRVDNSSPTYTGGNGVYWNGSAWFTYGFDCMFETYSEVAVVNLAGTGGGIGGGSAILAKTTVVNLAGTGGGVGSGSAALYVFGMPSGGAGVSRTYRRVVVAGNDKIYYEDI